MYKLCKIEKSAKRQREIEDTLMCMMEKQEFSKIKVVQLCENAGIPRKSFYVYFESKEDVLYALLEHTIYDLDFYEIERNQTETYTFCELKRFFSFWKEKEILLNGLCKSGFSGLLITKVMEHTIKNEKNIPFIYWAEDKKPSEIALKYAITGLMSMVLDWHKGGYSQETEEMTKLAVDLLTTGYFKNI